MTYALRSQTSKRGLEPLYFSVGMDNLLANQQQDIYYHQDSKQALHFNGINLWGIPYGTRIYLGVGYDLSKEVFVE